MSDILPFAIEMFAKVYSYIWGETETEAIATQDLLQECKEDNFIEKIKNIPSPNQIDEGHQINNELIQTESIPDSDEDGWIHVKDYKVEALSDNESIISSVIEKEKKKAEVNARQLAIKGDGNSSSRVLKVKVSKRRKDSRKKEMQKTVANSTRLEIPLLQELFNKTEEHNFDQQNSDRRMTRKAMKMSNSTALVNSSSNKPTRRRFYYTPNGFSGVVNNRKC